jgi:hypothetical protein
VSTHVTQRTVWKYVVGFDDLVLTNLINPRVVHVGIDPATQELAVWIDHHLMGDSYTGAPDYLRVRVCATGGNVPAGWRHAGSVIVPPYVWHVYATL